MPAPRPLPELAYDAATALAAPALLLSRLAAREGGAQATGERFGRGGPGDGAARLWVHGASVGEAVAGAAVIAAARALRPDLPVIATAHTMTGREVLARGPEGAAVRLAPWDTPGAVGRFLSGWSPAAYVFTDSELWPGRLRRLHRAGCAILGANARISERSAARWARRAPGMAARMLARIDLLCPQDAASGARFVALGLPPDRLGPAGSLKAALAPSAPLPDDAEVRRHLSRESTVLAASTHPGEESLALDAYLAARRDHPALRLVLAPRHPPRAAEVAQMVAARGLRPVLRSGGKPGALAERDAVLVVDTLGELRRFYAMAALAFVGGSTGTLGGHTPFEPAAEGCGIAHGPDTANAADAYDALRRAEGALEVADADGLAAAFACLARPDDLAAMVKRAAAALSGLRSEAAALVAERAVRAIDARRGRGAAP